LIDGPFLERESVSFSVKLVDHEEQKINKQL
jgi:hypothetical protein